MKKNNIKEFIKLNTFKLKKETSENILVMDRSRPEQILRSSMASIILNELYNYNPILMTERPSNSWVCDLYRSFGIKNFIFLRSLTNQAKSLNIIIKSFFLSIFYVFFVSIKGFEYFINNFKIKNTEVGDLLYDEYIRRKLRFLNPSPFNIYFFKTLYKSFFIIFFLDKVIKEKKIKLLITSSKYHATLNSLGCRFASKQKIPVLYCTYNRAMFLNYEQSLVYEDKMYEKDMLKIPNQYFSNDDLEEFVKSRMKGESNTAGKTIQPSDIMRAYANKLELDKNEILKIYNLNSKEIKYINLFTVHLFADATHYGGKFFLFKDTYSQFIETINKINKNTKKDTLWIVKPHPNAAFFNEENIVEQYLNKINNPLIKLYPEKISLKSFLTHSDKLITGRGNSGVEYACIGKKPIIAGECYYADLEFAHFPKTKKEYFDLVLNNDLDNNLTNEQTLNAKKTLYLIINTENISYGNIIPRYEKNFRLRADINHFFELLNNKIKNNSFELDPYFIDLKKFIFENLKKENEK